ncbi:TVP38 TMEM64 family membrane protein [Musa troglodytarum]|uniref:TVP38 TMEM64 family membrane protein n=1 Tax=Musa troglodytarum TaxID=320322 RepID=A0A9E7EN77_9LILI|nr:TVP38 TMEM64 family membrane protein [Musa troglodytarum]
MTYRAQDVENIVVLDAKLSAGEVNGDYVRLGDGEPRRVAGCCRNAPTADAIRFGGGSGWSSSNFKVALLSQVKIEDGFPQHVVVPFLNWEMATFSRPVLGLLLFVCIALFPTMILPSSPCMWIAGMTFGYGYGFLLIMAGSSIGMSLPFFVGSFFRHNIHRWLEKWPKKAAIVKLAGEGDWFHQFRAVVLLRISPFPYIIFNYAAVATNVEYGPYISGSLVGTIHETFITIYSGRLLQSLADATNTGGFLSLEQVSLSDGGDEGERGLLRPAFDVVAFPVGLLLLAVRLRSTVPALGDGNGEVVGNKEPQTNAWRSVDTNSRDTMAEDMSERLRARPLLTKQGAASAYLMVASEAVVIGNVYDHHATENLQNRRHGIIA